MEPIDLSPYVQYNDLVYDAHTRTGENSNVGSGCLWDYFGLPLADWDSTSGGNATPISLLPFKAYGLIYNEYYRDQNVDPEYEIFVDQSGRQVLNSSGRFGFSFHFDVPRRRWLKDYFTSALPTPQRGPDVTLPIAGQANVVLSDTNNAGRFVAPNGASMAPPDRYDVIASNINSATSGYSISAAPSKTESGYSLTYDPNGSLKADLSTATAVTINDLRRAIALQKFYEISARAGSRYKETIMGHFHVTSSDARLQRPEYLGGGVSTINISEIPQTSATGSASPQGNLAGKGFGIGRSNRSSFFAEEHGYLIGILSIIPDAIYYQGINKSWNRLNQEDYYWPSFAHLGEQPILKSELYAPYEINTFSQLFGYAPRYAEYKYAPSTIHGLFRTQLANWTFARKLSAANLNSDFLQVPNITNPYAVQDNTDKYLIWISHKIDALRPMPFFGTPSI